MEADTVARVRKSRRRVAKADEHETGSVLIGLAYEMPEHALSAMALAEDVPIDFQARQDSIAETRRIPTLAPKLKRTRARPAPARETNLKL